jgi:hypothetical protein
MCLNANHATNVASIVKAFSMYGLWVAANKNNEAIISYVARILKDERQKQKLSLNLLVRGAGVADSFFGYLASNVSGVGHRSGKNYCQSAAPNQKRLRLEPTASRAVNAAALHFVESAPTHVRILK